MAFVRDVSDSMWGGRAMLASAVTQAAINLAEAHKMRFGYCEFALVPKLYRQTGGDGRADEKDYFAIDGIVDRGSSGGGSGGGEAESTGFWVFVTTGDSMSS